MPELPEVQTTVNGLQKYIIGLKITDVWSNYNSKYYHGSETIKNPKYFKHFKKKAVGEKIISVERRAKNILINLSQNKTILVHMKMTGHLLYGQYKFNFSTRSTIKADPWEPISPFGLKDPYNRHVRFIITFNNHKCLALSDTRRFAKIALVDSKTIYNSDHLSKIGPEPLDKMFTFEIFNKQLNKKPHGKIKLVLMDQNIIAGLGNIYADETLWYAGTHPLTLVKDLNKKRRKLLFVAIKKILSRSISAGGDSMSDYRNIRGEKGGFQEQHKAYQKTGEKCSKLGCEGKITRIVVGGRGTHYCNQHQK